ncbi:hypothetical protein AB4P97_19370 [Pseudomonas sp. A1230]|uniref:hypothetical protein n=1 Tax=Pseudomonas sp. A1230 TaxID=3235106 RepID=UPI00378344BA
MATRKLKRKALFIDDAFARPTVSDFQKQTVQLRRFLKDNVETRVWFDEQFGLDGEPSGRLYFEPLTSKPEEILRFWSIRNKSPSKNQLVKHVFSDLVEELSQHHKPLSKIERILKSKGWSVVKTPALPDLDLVETDVSLIIIDYLLSNEVPDDIEGKVAESIAFLKSVITRAKQEEGCTHPFVILISSLPNLAESDAYNFRKSSSTPGGFFRFVRKLTAEAEFSDAVDTFSLQEGELKKFRSVHVSLERAISSAAHNLLEQIEGLELEDLATLYTAQLVTEKEPLSDYLGWLSGQLLTASIQKDITLAEKSMDLPPESYEVLLGHCEPTQNVSNLFSDFSSVKPASGELFRNKNKQRQIRFGDLFVKLSSKKSNGSGKEAIVNAPDATFLMVISQTCDLLQGKITNGQVLCVQGSGRQVEPTEIELLRATIKQMGSDGDILIRNGEKFTQIEWGNKNLLTVDQKTLSKELGFSYLGRLNEIYALEVQHTALHQLGRIGVPIVPGYRVFFGAVEIRVFSAKSELSDYFVSLNNSSVLAVLRSEKIASSIKQRLLFSGELHRWLSDRLSEMLLKEGFPNGLIKNVTDISAALKSVESFSTLVKFKEGMIDGFSREPITELGEDKVQSIPNGVLIVLKDLPRVEKNIPSPRVQITFLPSIQFHKDNVDI